MVIGGYSMEDNGVYGITVKQHESGWSFFMDGDDAEIFAASGRYGNCVREKVLRISYTRMTTTRC